MGNPYDQNMGFDRALRPNNPVKIGGASNLNSALVSSGNAAILGHQNLSNEVQRRESNLFADQYTGQRIAGSNGPTEQMAVMGTTNQFKGPSQGI